MAETKQLIIPDNFSMQRFMDSFVILFKQKGYDVTPAAIDRGATAYISKNETGLPSILGLSNAIRVSFTVYDNTMTVAFSDEKWTDKIICLIIGFCCCLIPFITGLIGGIKQSELPNEVFNTAVSLVNASTI